MKLHIFNPEHDIALANNMNVFTAPHAARALRADLGYLPALWAADGDMVLVDDVSAALESVRHLGGLAHDVLFVSGNDLPDMPLDFSTISIEPWGWNKALRHHLVSANSTFGSVMPTDEDLENIRQFSCRTFAANHLLPRLTSLHERFVGESTYFTGDVSVLPDMLTKEGERFVLKAPWSSSGRGLRYVDHDFTSHVQGWCRNLIKTQGGVMIEPQYNKVKDFGMEYMSMGDGGVEYLGLSLFSTIHGAYAGNIIAPERVKQEIIAKYVPLELLSLIRAHIVPILGSIFKGRYIGPFGVDMMIVAVEGRNELCIHPCVEINLRRTMGHVAIALAEPYSTKPKQLMYIEYTDKYRLKTSLVGDDLLIPHTL